MNRLEEHFKDRNPNDTINIIKQFFYDRGYEIKFNYVSSPIGVESCHLKLFKDDIYIMKSNGKGMDKNYALASGLGELYERFCGKHDQYLIKHIQFYLGEESFSKNGYYYYSNEKIVDDIKNLNIPNNLLQHYSSFLNTNDINIIDKYLKFIANNNLVEVPYINAFDENEKIYLNLPILYHLTGSNGLAAGNTFYEAFNEGSSELIERFCLNKFCQLTDKYYSIDINSIKNKKLKTMLKNIENDNNKVILLDLSYTYDLPVIGLITLNKINLNTTIVFGCFPIFDIALERCITETYQNISLYTSFNTNLKSCYNYNYNNNKPQFLEQMVSTPQQQIFPYEIFNNISTKKSFNKNGFMPLKNYTNKEIYDWILRKLKEKNISIFYRDTSLTDTMKAIHLYSYEMSDATDFHDVINNNCIVNVMIEGFNDLTDYYNNYNNYLNFKDDDSLINILNFYYKKASNYDYDVLTQQLGHQIIFLPTVIPFDNYYFLSILLKIYENGVLNLSESDLNYIYSLSNLKEFTPIKNDIIIYTTLIKFIRDNIEIGQIQNIFNIYELDINIEKEIENINNNNLYFLKKTFFKFDKQSFKNILNKMYGPMIAKE